MNNIKSQYAEYKSKHKDKYRLTYGKRFVFTVLNRWTESKDKIYQIEVYTKQRAAPSKDPKYMYWSYREDIKTQPRKGMLSIIGIGSYEYTAEEWAMKCFIEYVDKQERVIDKPVVV